MKTNQLEIKTWEACYDKSLKGFITEDSFTHPAKMSLALCERIITYCLAKGWIKKGDVVGDPFNGICTTGLVSAYHGLRYVGVELEEKFVNLSRENIRLHKHRLELMALPVPVVVQGDSRRFHEFVQAAGVVSSPPFSSPNMQPISGYGGSCSRGGQGVRSELKAMGYKPETNTADQRAAGNIETLKEGDIEAVVSSPPFNQNKANVTHGESKGVHSYDENESKSRMKRDYFQPETAGNIGDLAHGNVEAVVSSPPYSDIAAGQGGLNTKPPKHPGQQSGRTVTLVSQNSDQHYGTTPGQIGKLKGGCVDAIATSPPYADSNQDYKTGFSYINKEKMAVTSHVRISHLQEAQYGKSAGQIGNESQQTYWQAVAQVYASCFQAIKPGGVICLVVKDYVKQGKRVPLCDDTARLLEHTGFKVIERIHAMLVKETRHDDLFDGETVQTKSRKSFFRRLAESKGSPKIDFEEVIIARRPLE